MASFLYDYGREGFLAGDIDWDGDTIHCMLLDGDYTPTQATDQFMSDIPAGAKVDTSELLTNRTVVGGEADADDVTFTAVTNATDIVGAVIYKQVGGDDTTPADDRLIAYIDFVDICANGGDISISWQATSPFIFKL